MRKELQSSIEIESSPEKVWSIITDFSRFPEWNPFIRWARGEIKEGAKLVVHIEPSGARGTTFKPTMLHVEPNRELRWIGHLWIGGLFDGEHRLSIVPLASDRVRFNQSEMFSGLLVRFLAKSLDRDTLRGFNEMNQALKKRAESAYVSICTNSVFCSKSRRRTRATQR